MFSALRNDKNVAVCSTGPKTAETPHTQIPYARFCGHNMAPMLAPPVAKRGELMKPVMNRKRGACQNPRQVLLVLEEPRKQLGFRNTLGFGRFES